MSSAVLNLSFIVPQVVTCLLTQVSPLKYTIQETSNVPTGYTVSLETDKQGTYEGVSFSGPSLLTNVASQDVATTRSKLLEFTSVPTYVTITCQPND